jgi:hypothetical protein
MKGEDGPAMELVDEHLLEGMAKQVIIKWKEGE